MMPNIIILQVRKFHQPLQTILAQQGKNLWGGGGGGLNIVKVFLHLFLQNCDASVKIDYGNFKLDVSTKFFDSQAVLSFTGCIRSDGSYSNGLKIPTQIILLKSQKVDACSFWYDICQLISVQQFRGEPLLKPSLCCCNNLIVYLTNLSLFLGRHMWCTPDPYLQSEFFPRSKL